MGRYDILLQQEEPKPAQSVAKPERPNGAVPTSPQARSDRGISERANARTIERSNGKRIITRNSFETYEDQMDSLRELAFQEKRQGKLGSMSAMVRDAIDEYLARNKR
jgi:hypothetical protein